MKRPRVFYLSENTYIVVLQFFVCIFNLSAFLIMHFAATIKGNENDNMVFVYFFFVFLVFFLWVIYFIERFRIYKDEFWKLVGCVVIVVGLFLLELISDSTIKAGWKTMTGVALANVGFLVFLKFQIKVEPNCNGRHTDQEVEEDIREAVNRLMDKASERSSRLEDLDLP